MDLIEGCTYKLAVPLTINKEEIDIANISVVEFTFDKVRKIYGTYSDEESEKTGDVTFDANSKKFIIPLTQEETFKLKGNRFIEYQARIKFTDNEVKASKIYNGRIRRVLSKKVL